MIHGMLLLTSLFTFLHFSTILPSFLTIFPSPSLFLSSSLSLLFSHTLKYSLTFSLLFFPCLVCKVCSVCLLTRPPPYRTFSESLRLSLSSPSLSYLQGFLSSFTIMRVRAYYPEFSEGKCQGRSEEALTSWA